MRCFLQWFALLLTYLCLVAFSFLFGIPQAIWQADVTHMTSLIALTFIAVVGYIGWATWRFEHETYESIQRGDSDTNIGRTSAFVVTLMGLLGTAFGLMMQVQALAKLDVANASNITGFIQSTNGSLGTALYSTTCGIVACVGITLMNLNLEYFLDRNRK